MITIKKQVRLFRPADFVLIIAVIGCAVMLFIHQSTRSSGRFASVEQDDRMLIQIDLSDPSYRTYTVEDEYPMTIATENGRVWVSVASCPDQHCVRSGKLHRAGDVAVCIPAGLILRVSGTPAHDGVTG